MFFPALKGGPLISLIALVLAIPSATWAADESPEPSPPAGQQERQQDDELSAVLVEGTRSESRVPSFKEYQEPFDWLARVVGTFVIDGTVELHAPGAPQGPLKVSGRAECIGFGVGPGVLCNLQARWPATHGPDGEEILGGVSTLEHAALILGNKSVISNKDVGRISTRFDQPGLPGEFGQPIDIVEPGITHVLVDSRGIVETAIGRMVNADTMQSRAKCFSVGGSCERAVRIYARPDLSVVEMNIELVIDGYPAVSYAFVMHRIPGRPAVVFGREPSRDDRTRDGK